MQPLDIAALITAATILLFQVVSFNVGRARGKYGVQAPSTTGPEGFERAFRVQMNTLEQLAFFLPALWLFAIYMPYVWPLAGFGGLWIVGRILYAQAYYKNPAKRTPGFVMAMFGANALLLGGIIGLVMDMSGAGVSL
jgi:uncharacterized membrane protein YecN with MAPEG domain